MEVRNTVPNKGLNAMGAEVVNSTFVLLLNFCGLLNICASNPSLRQAPKRCKQFMKNRILKIFFVLFLFFISCEEKKDVIEIYLTKNKIESYDGVPLRVAIKDRVIINQVIESYGEEIRIDTVKDKPIYMGHFLVTQKDLEEKAFINDSEILGFDFESSEIHFSKSVADKIYKSIPNWRKKNHFGKQFVLCHNGKIVLGGYLLGSWSAYWANTYQISYHPYPEHKRNDTIKSVAFSMRDSLNFEKYNLKNNKLLYNTFKNRLIN